MTRKEVSKILNIPISTLQYYDNTNLIKPKRNANNYRDYSEEDVKKLKFILYLKNMQFTIDEIKIVLAHYSFTKIDMPKNRKIDFYKNKITEMKKIVEEYSNTVKILEEVVVLLETNITDKDKLKIQLEINDMVNNFFKKEDSE